MNCQEQRIRITAWIDHSLEAESVALVKQHLGTCSSCARFYREQADLSEWLNRNDVCLTPSPMVWERIEATLSRHPSRRESHFSIDSFLDLFRLPALRYALASTAAFIFFSLFLFDVGSHPREERQLLLSLKAYTLEVDGNPFQERMDHSNPFFTSRLPGDQNPFIRGGSPE